MGSCMLVVLLVGVVSVCGETGEAPPATQPEAKEDTSAGEAIQRALAALQLALDSVGRAAEPGVERLRAARDHLASVASALEQRAHHELVQLEGLRSALQAQLEGALNLLAAAQEREEGAVPARAHLEAAAARVRDLLARLYAPSPQGHDAAVTQPTQT